MQETQFKAWLGDEQGLSFGSIRSRISNCKRVERFEGDLDGHWDKDRLGGLASRLVYSRKDERDASHPKHRVPIDGNVYEGTATLRNAVGLYRQFRSAGDETTSSPAPFRIWNDEEEALNVLTEAVRDEQLDQAVRVNAAVGLLIWSTLQSIAGHFENGDGGE